MSHTNYSTVYMSEPLPFLSMELDVVLTTNPTYKGRTAYGLKINTMHTATCLHDNEAGLNLINYSFTHPSWRSNRKRAKMPNWRKANRQPKKLDRLTFLHLRKGDLCARVWYGIALNLAMNVVLGTPFFHRFTFGIFPTKRKIVSMNSPPVDIGLSKQK